MKEAVRGNLQGKGSPLGKEGREGGLRACHYNKGSPTLNIQNGLAELCRNNSWHWPFSSNFLEWPPKIWLGLKLYGWPMCFTLINFWPSKFYYIALMDRETEYLYSQELMSHPKGGEGAFNYVVTALSKVLAVL